MSLVKNKNEMTHAKFSRVMIRIIYLKLAMAFETITIFSILSKSTISDV